MTECIVCGAMCHPFRTHPAVEADICSGCLATIRERLTLYGLPARLPPVDAMRADDL